MPSTPEELEFLALDRRNRIDQANTLERNAQVQQMGEIYSQASEVIIWLGDALDDSCLLEDVCHVADLGDKCAKDDILMRRAALYDVFLRPWYTRLWVCNLRTKFFPNLPCVASKCS